MRALRLAALGLALVCFAILAGALIPRPLFSVARSASEEVTIYVATNPIHTDILIPADAQSLADFGFLQEGLPLNNPSVQWLMFGWGGRGFYIETPTWSAMKAGPVFRALTVDRSTMHVEVLGKIDAMGDALIPVTISKADLEDMRREILATFSREGDQVPQLIAGAAYGAYDQFYEANGYFNALLGCNTWTARMLRAAGVRTGLWNPFPQSLRFSLTLYN